MRIQLSDHFSYNRLLRFTFPSIIMMVFTSIYSVVDGIFVSNFVGSNAISSVNIIFPLTTLVGAFGFMLGTGGSAEIARAFGEGRRRDARQYFTTLILTIIAIGIVTSVVCIVFIRPLSYLMGANDVLIEGCVTYGTILLIGNTFFMLQVSFQAFFVVAEKPKIGLALTIVSGLTNMVLDFVFVYVMELGLAGAAIATVMGYIVGGAVPLVYFLTHNSSLLHFEKTHVHKSMLLRSCGNGSSEMVSNISMSIVTVLYNLQMMHLAGEDGVAAISVIMYVNFIFVAILLGFSVGTAPIIGYHYGAGNHSELKNMFRKSIAIVAVVSIAMTVLAETVATPIVALFLGKGNPLSEMTVHGFKLYSLSFLICGLNIYGSSFFTALCNGKISAMISFLRALLLPSSLIYILPLLWGLDGVWLAVVAAELITALFTIWFFASQKKRYHYA